MSFGVVFHRACQVTAFLLGGLGGAPLALATCSINDVLFIPQDVEMDMGRVVILPGMAINSVIKEITVPITQRSIPMRCTSDVAEAHGEYTNARQQSPVENASHTYATDVEGVGIRVFRDSGSVQAYYPHVISLKKSGTLKLVGGMFRVQLIKTAEQTGSGPLAPTGRFTRYYLDGDGPGRPLLVSSFKGSGTSLVRATCTVENDDIRVDLGAVSHTAFTGLGARAAGRDFDIQLTCQGANLPGAEFQSLVTIRLDDVAGNAASSGDGVLKLSAVPDAATGVGIQIVRRQGEAGEAAVKLGMPIEVGRTQYSATRLTLPLRAHYIQTLTGPVGAGIANGQATFTIDYQ